MIADEDSPSPQSDLSDCLHNANMEELTSSLERFHNESDGGFRTVEDHQISMYNYWNSPHALDGEFVVEFKQMMEEEDSGLGETEHGCCSVVETLEKKVDSLIDIFTKQNKELKQLADTVSESNKNIELIAEQHHQMIIEFLDEMLAERLEELESQSGRQAQTAGAEAAGFVNSRAKALLDALEFKQKNYVIDEIVKQALTEFLQSDALLDAVQSATAAEMKTVIQSCFADDVTASYLPLLEKSYRRLWKHVTRILDEAFGQLMASASSISRSYASPRTLKSTVERSQRIIQKSFTPANTLRTLKITVHQVMRAELIKWREEVKKVISKPAGLPKIREIMKKQPPPVEYVAHSPTQPTEPGKSVIEQLMSAAEINVTMQKGDINGSFEKALSAADLSLVMAACRAADPADIFGPPCCLSPNVLLSLVQQLATDMVHETPLKCRYLEEALLNLNPDDVRTRCHLPKVLREVIDYLSSFLTTYPSHMSSRRIKMIIMAAKSLHKTTK